MALDRSCLRYPYRYGYRYRYRRRYWYRIRYRYRYLYRYPYRSLYRYPDRCSPSISVSMRSHLVFNWRTSFRRKICLAEFFARSGA